MPATRYNHGSWPFFAHPKTPHSQGYPNMIELVLSAFLCLCFIAAFVFIHRYEANRRA